MHILLEMVIVYSVQVGLSRYSGGQQPITIAESPGVVDVTLNRNFGRNGVRRAAVFEQCSSSCISQVSRLAV